jgi:hypothetical protein
MKGGKSTMNKPIYKSKTVWGFGAAGLIKIGAILGVALLGGVIGAVLMVCAGLFGVYGLRDAVGKK